MATKKFIEIKIPLLDLIVEVPSIGSIDGKTIKLDLTRILKGKSVEIIFIVDGKENKAYPKKLRLFQFYVKRLVRKGTSYVEDSFPCKTKNGILRVKPLLVTRKRVSRSIRKSLRNKARELIEKYFKEKTKDDIFSSVLYGKLQKDILPELKKIYPLAVCEIRVIEPERKHIF